MALCQDEQRGHSKPSPLRETDAAEQPLAPAPGGLPGGSEPDAGTGRGRLPADPGPRQPGGGEVPAWLCCLRGKKKKIENRLF